MTEEAGMDRGRSSGSAEGHGLPEARRHRTRWPGWVWLIPLGAVLLVGWFVYHGWIVGSHEVTVRFDDAGGVSRGAPVVYKGVQSATLTASASPRTCRRRSCGWCRPARSAAGSARKPCSGSSSRASWRATCGA